MNFSGRMRILKVFLVSIVDIAHTVEIQKLVRLMGYRILQLFEDAEESNETKLTKKSEIDFLFLCASLGSQLPCGEKRNEKLKEKLDSL